MTIRRREGSARTDRSRQDPIGRSGAPHEAIAPIHSVSRDRSGSVSLRGRAHPSRGRRGRDATRRSSATTRSTIPTRACRAVAIAALVRTASRRVERARLAPRGARHRRARAAARRPRSRRGSVVPRRARCSSSCWATTTRGWPKRPRTRSASTRVRRAPRSRRRCAPRPATPIRSCARPRSPRSARRATRRRLRRCSPAATTSPRSGGGAVLALAAFDGDEVEARLRLALDDPDWQVRQAAEDLLAVTDRGPPAP